MPGELQTRLVLTEQRTQETEDFRAGGFKKENGTGISCTADTRTAENSDTFIYSENKIFLRWPSSVLSHGPCHS